VELIRKHVVEVEHDVLDDADILAANGTSWHVLSLLIVFLEGIAIGDDPIEKDWTNARGTHDSNIAMAIAIVDALILRLTSEFRCIIQFEPSTFMWWRISERAISGTNLEQDVIKADMAASGREVLCDKVDRRCRRCGRCSSAVAD